MKRFLMAAVMLSVATGAFAQAYNIKEMTPAVQASLEARKARFSELKAQKAAHTVGENNRGYVEALGGGAEVKALVAAENKDRKMIYQAIVDQNDLGAGALATVEQVFAGVQRSKAEPGEKVQSENGSW